MMPYISFIYPHMLWLLLLLPCLWLLAFSTPGRLTTPVRFWLSLGLRTTLIVGLVGSLAGAQIRYPVNQVTTVFLLDASDSVTPAARAEAETFIEQALAAMRNDDQAALVVFGENALVERAPDSANRLGRLRSLPLAAHTDIEEAIGLGLALLPADAQKRLVLLSDGGENVGSAAEAARIAASRQVPIDIVDLGDSSASDEVRVVDLDAPTRVRDGQDVELRVIVESDTAQPALLRLLQDRLVITERNVALEAGTNEFRFTVPAEGQGFQRYRAQIEPQDDSRLQNNEAAALVQVQGMPRVLLVEGAYGEANTLREALEAARMEAEVISPDLLPTDLASLSAYEAVVLVNVPVRDLPVQSVAALPTYVRDLGRGLVMIGGTSSYGVGGYGNTPIEAALPVYMDVRNRLERPDLALAFVIDKSGSMDACHCSGPNRVLDQFSENGEPKIDIAKEAVIQAAALLGARDTLGIVTFDTNATQTLPATRGANADEVADALSSVRPRGNTNVREGLREAEAMLDKTSAQIKHVILLTDGWGEGGNHLDIARRMRQKGITISVVAAGSGSASYLENLANAGGGRYYPADLMEDVPQIFLQETIVAAGHYIIEHPFFPARASDSPLLEGIGEEGWPLLYGYNGSTLKDTARNVLVSDDSSPLLAQWQYGLGRSIAWTSDTKGQWARDLLTWEDFPRFAAQMIGWVLPTFSDERIDADIRVEGSQVIIDATVQDEAGNPDDSLQMTARMLRSNTSTGTPPDTDAAEAPPETEEITLHQVAPGQYRASIPAPTPGSYLLQLGGSATGEAGGAVQSTVGLVVPYSAEYRHDQQNPDVLAGLADLTGGAALDDPAGAFARNLPRVSRAQEIGLPLLVLVLLLLPLDIAVRRLLLRRRDFAGVEQWTQSQINRLVPPARPTPPPDSSLMTRLNQARQQQTTPQAEQPAPSIRPEAPARPAPPPVAESPRQAEPPPPPPAPKPAAPKPAAQAPTDPLERLRAAKQRARRRGRGDEER